MAQDASVAESKIIATDMSSSTAEASSAAADRSTATARLQQDQQTLLANATIAPKSLWLKTQTEFLAFWQADLSGSPKGALLLLPDTDHNPVWPETLLNLHEYLPQYGWATLSIDLLTPPPPVVPPRTTPVAPIPKAPADTEEASDPPPAEEPDKVVDETQVVHQEADPNSAEAPPAKSEAMDPEATLKENQQRIQQGITYLQSQGQYNIVLLGFGRGGYQALQFLHTQKLPTPKVAEGQNPRKKAIVDRAIRALVTVDLHNHYPQATESADNLMHMPEIPYMDISTEIGLGAQEELHQRKLTSRLRQYELYRQRQLTPAKGIVYDKKETELTRTVRGFLQRYASGQKL